MAVFKIKTDKNTWLPIFSIPVNGSFEGYVTEAWVTDFVNRTVAEHSDGVRVLDLTLSAANWQNGIQTLTISGLAQETNGIIGITQDINPAQLEACKNALIYVSNQTTNALTFTANGVIPTIDIPLSIIIYGSVENSVLYTETIDENGATIIAFAGGEG